MKVSLFLLVKKIEHLIKIFSFAIPKFKTHSKYGFGFSYQQKNPFKISLYSKLKTELKNLFKTLFLMTANHRLVSIYTVLTLVGLSVSIYSLLSNEATSDFKNKASSSLVLAEQSSVEDYLITFNNETLFNQPVTFAQPIVAPNVTYSVTAGTGIRVVGDDPQNPTITNSGVLSIASLTGAIDIEAGSNIELEILNNAINIEATDQLRGKVFTISQGGTGAVNSSDARKNLGLVIDTDVQSYSTLLKNISQVTPVTSGFLTTDENQNWVMVSGAFARNRIGLGKDNEVEFKKITIGENEGLNIDSAGNFTKINGVAIRFPSVQGALNSVLLNDGAGNLIWTDSTGSGSIGYFSRNNLTATLSTSNAGDSLNLGTGSLIMSGAVTTSGIISGTGSGLTNLNASNISSGTIPVASVVGTYANITGVGTLSSGTWQGAPVADTYIQSAVNWNTAYSNRITSLTTSGSSGASTLTSNTLNIPTYTLAGLGGQPQLNGTGFVKINGTTIIYDANTYLTGNQTITLSGDVTGSGATAIATTIGDGKVTNAKLSNSSITIGSTSVGLGSSITALSDITSLSVNGIISGTGSGLTNLNASNISSGTIPTASVVGAYANITGVGTLSSLNVTGAITSGDITSSNIISGTSFRGGLGSISAPTFSFTNDSNTGMFSRTDILGFVTSGTEQMTILSSGNVGIGTTAPAYFLDVAGTIRTNDLISQNLSLSSLSTSIINAEFGYDGYTKFTGGIGTGGNGKDSILGAQRITSQGNLVNIGSIQAGELNITRGGTFAAQATYPAGSGPYSVSTGDLNGDGKADLVVTNAGSNNVSVYINNGNGTFAAQVTYSVGSFPTSVSTGDLNGDGKADLAVAIFDSNNVSVLLNNGNGTFPTQATYPAGSNPQSVSTGDLNGDGKADLAVANLYSNNVSVLLNNGNGTFPTQATYPAGSGPYSVSTGDLNGDGKADLAVTNSGSNNVSVLLNNGNGTFAAQVTYSVGSFPTSVSTGDLNGDGKADLAVANLSSDNISVLLNNGNGTFAAQVTYSVGLLPNSVSTGDLNGDGKADLAVTNYDSNNVSVLLNNGNGTFAAQVTYSVGSLPTSVSTGDLNGDGKADLAVANSGSDNISVLLNNNTPVLFAQASTGNVGIGTTNPSVALQVAGAITSSGIISGTGSGLTNLNASNISSGTIPVASVVGAYPNITGVGTLSSLNVTGAITSGDITSSNIISGTSFRGGLGSISEPTFSFTSDSNTGMFSRTDVLGLVTSGTEQMTILSNGNVGIGTTSPGNKLEVKGAGTDAVENVLGVYNTLTEATAKGKGAAIQLGWSNAQYYSKIATIFESRNPDYLRPSLAFFTMDESDTVSSERLRISSAGNVGIGTTNPTQKLEVVGNILASGIISGTGSGLTNLNASNISSGTIPAASVVGTYANITGVGTLSSLNVTGAITSGDITSSGIISGTSFRGGLGSISAPTFSFTNDSNTGIFSPSADILGFVTSGTERMRIDPSGNVGIGTTNPSTMLDIFGTSSALQLSYDANDYARFSIASDGKLTLAGVSSGGSLTNIANFSTTQANFDVPTSFNSVGDISVAYDINLSNQTASNIKSDGPLTISSGEVFENLDLTLRTYGSGKFVVNSRNFWSDGDRVGIGTTSPGSLLDVQGNMEVGATNFPVRETGFGYDSITYKVLQLGYSDTANRSLALNIDPSSIVGSNFTGRGQILIPKDRSILAPNNENSDWGGVLRYTNNLLYLGGNLSGGELYGDALVVKSNGNVGIGTTNPGAKLEVAQGNINVSRDDAHAFISVRSSGVSNLPGLDFYRSTGTIAAPFAVNAQNVLGLIRGWGYNSSSYNIGAGITFYAAENWTTAANGSYMTFGTNAIGTTASTERMRIDPSGNVGIGTTNPGNLLQVGSSSRTDGNQVSIIDANGTCTLNPGSGATWSCTSDERLKSNIISLNSVISLEKILQLEPRSFTMNKDGSSSIGFIAQEVQSIIPEAVTTLEDGFLAIDAGRFTPYVISSIQEQQLQISGISSNLSTLTEELDLKLNEETGEIVTSINSLINSTSATNDLINLNQTANITTITALDSRVEVLENYSLDISDFQASASATLSELNQRIGLFEQIMSLTSTDSATLSASSALESLIDSRILGAFTSQIATFSALTVTSGANINNLAVTGNMTNGLLTINGFDDSLATPSATLSTLSGPLKIQHQALGEIDFMGGKAIIDTNGDFKIITGDFEISSGVIKGNNQFRGFDLSITPNSLEVDVIFETNRLSNEYTVSVLPSWLTNVAIIQKRTDGFKIKFSNLAPVDAKIDWLIIE